MLSATRLAVLLGLLSVLVCNGAEMTADQVKARYIVSFTKYFTWPSTPTGGVFRIGLPGGHDVSKALEEVLRGKSDHGNSFELVHLEHHASFSNLRVLYLGEAGRDRVARILEKVEVGTLLIGEGPAFLPAGGMIELKMTEGKVRFRVNLKAIREAGLSVDSKLLAIAEEVLQ